MAAWLGLWLASLPDPSAGRPWAAQPRGAWPPKWRDGGFKEERLKTIGESVKPGTSALVAVVEETWVIEAEKILREAAANIVTEAISADIAAQLETEGERLQTEGGDTKAA